MDSRGSEESVGIFNTNLIHQFVSLSIPSPIYRYTNQEQEHAVNLSRDILVGILTCLPVKSAFRFKCVSKWWYQVISDPCFVNKIRIRRTSSRLHRNDTLLGFFRIIPSDFLRDIDNNWLFMPTPSTEREEGEGEEEKETVKSLQSSFPRKIDEECICSSDGLFLLRRSRNSSSSSSYQYKEYSYYIFNPLTREYYRLPLSPLQKRRQKQQKLKDKNKLSRLRPRQPELKPCMGIVVDDTGAATYRVIRIVAAPFPIDNSEIIEIETFSSETGLWELTTRRVTVHVYDSFFKLNLPEQKYKTAVTGGAIYWISKCNRNRHRRHPPRPYVDDDDYDDDDCCTGGGCGIIAYHPPLQCDKKGTIDGDNGIIEVIKGPPCNGFWVSPESYLDNILDSSNGLLQMATLRISDSAMAMEAMRPRTLPHIIVWVFDSNSRRWFVRHTHWIFGESAPSHSTMPKVVPRRGNYSGVPCLNLLAFHPHNPKLVFININGFIFLHQLEASTTSTASLTEPKIPSRQLYINFSLQPYLLPIWPISALPLPLLLQRNMQRRPNNIYINANAKTTSE